MKKYRFSTQVLLNFLFVILTAVMFCSCSGGGGGSSSGDSDTTPTPTSSAKAITAFSFVSPAAIGTITESTHSIAITVPSGTNVKALIPAITHTGASINPASGVAQDFTNPVTYTVTAEDASMQDYTITVTVDASPSASDTWTRKADFGGTARHASVGFSIGSKGYIGLGESNDSPGDLDFWEYDPTANSWTQMADFGGTSRIGAVGFSIGSKGYIGTGRGGSSYKDFWEYNPTTNQWTRKADFGGTARIGAVGFSIGSRGYIGTGADDSDGTNYCQKDFWEYNPTTNIWTRKADFGGATREGAVGFSIGSMGYIGTGLYGPDDTNYNDFWAYDPTANTWTQKADFEGEARTSSVGFSIGSKGYIGTGVYESLVSKKFKDFWEYDPALNTWTRKADFGGTARYSAVGFSIGSKGYIGTGRFYGDSYAKDFWEYEP